MTKGIDILLVDDNKGDIELTLEAFKEGKLNNRIRVVNDGVEAIALLRQEGRFEQEKRPDLILLDLNMPRMDGREVLREIKTDPSLCTIPVIILTTSDNEFDVLATYGLHANCYIKKPISFENFITIIRKIEDFWVNVVRFPKHED